VACFLRAFGPQKACRIIMKHKQVRHYNIIGHAHELTFSCFQKEQFLNSDSACEFFIESLERARETKKIKIIAFVLMPEHVHLLIFPENEEITISKIQSAIKLPVSMKFSNFMKKNCNNRIERFWQRGGGYDRNIYTNKALKSSINYIHLNPVRRGLVNNPEDWYWSSAGYYAGLRDYPLRMDEEVLGILN
jgi:putative transposase